MQLYRSASVAAKTQFQEFTHEKSLFTRKIKILGSIPLQLPLKHNQKANHLHLGIFPHTKNFCSFAEDYKLKT